MFGYITPDRPYLFIKDETLYQALYCGLCKSIGAGCGQRARTALTYDMAFMSAMFHNILGIDVKIEKRRCAIHMIKRRKMAAVDDLTVLLGCVNTVLAYYKLLDDKQDGDKRAVLRHLYKKGFRRSIKKHPEIVEIVKRNTERQKIIEQAESEIIDEACEPTALMTAEISEYVLGERSTEDTYALFYDLGKWVYLADALDDYDKDVKKGRYNVLFKAFKGQTKKDTVQSGGDELKFVFDSLFADMRQRLANIKFNFNHDLTDNIILRGIPLKTRELYYCDCGNGKQNAAW